MCVFMCVCGGGCVGVIVCARACSMYVCTHACAHVAQRAMRACAGGEGEDEIPTSSRTSQVIPPAGVCVRGQVEVQTQDVMGPMAGGGNFVHMSVRVCSR